MSIQHTNRKGNVSYLHQGITKTGKPKYYFSSNSEGTLINEVPDGFEIYENPNAQVFLRRIQPKLITDDERAVVDNGMKQFSQLKYYIIDIKKTTISIFTPNQDVERLSETFLSFHRFQNAEISDVMPRYIDFSPMLQFELIDEKKRIFIAQRYCFRSSVDDWINLGKSGQLSELVKKYVKHLEQESYFDLF
ncbi:MAG: hypothetical protein IPH35_23905 [Rhodoferax sp.]|nr:hypothetical protein [Rhodoferax sp.]